MDKCIFNESNGLWYELVGDYYLPCLKLPEEEQRPDRNDQAIRATSDKYGHYCKAIAKNILNSKEDAEECVNDTYLNSWNAMPTHWPDQLATFLGKIPRNLSFTSYKHNQTSTRRDG